MAKKNLPAKSLRYKAGQQPKKPISRSAKKALKNIPDISPAEMVRQRYPEQT